MRFLLKENVLYPLLSREEGMPISRHTTIPHIPTNYQFPYSKQLQQHLCGKELLSTEIPFSLEELFSHYQNGFVRLNPGITLEKGRRTCNRCNNKDERFFAFFNCAKCGEQNCYYCRKCVMMGRVSECTPLFTWCGLIPAISERITLQWNGSLSQGQSRASDEVLQTINTNDELLVWAVCGAGKTEVLFKGLEFALGQGKKVCIATPRTDVVLELAPRLKKVFPTIEISALYGGSEDRNKNSSLYISTTHQLLRFKEAFDCVIVDEVDAFPYTADTSLQFAVKKSRKKESSLIYLTATPSKQWKKEVQQNKRNAVKIPLRYHGHHLPAPEFKWCGNWKKRLTKGQLPKNVESWLSVRLKSKKQAFLFVPSISVIQKVVDILKKMDGRIEGVYAEDPNRREKVLLFRSGGIPIIVTSTILERGVTIPNSDVAILGSEDEIFTESALVQISGRVGRSVAYPTGMITFFHYGKTTAMIEAKKHIEKMNEEAKK
ncbi:competence protein ComFA [Metabacillus crassostreae]|uniref:DEAD/DEAH box helicase n=1 Tax=Metabacillus crassostreae TaxID=929098 RepID=UPI0019588731|nr:DEAD/DEAH box helicase [Metabacillus crassostreae]MBM7606251.1 competence protein ComFA [Metabacillus crassostreae]